VSIALLAVSLATLSPAAAPPPMLDPDPLQRVAARALAGHYGPLKPWQARGYRKALANGSEPRLFVVTGYFPSEGRSGRVDRRGAPLHPGVIACNRLPYGSYVYLPAWGRLFVVKDCGSSRNDSRREVTRHGGTWAGVYLRRAREAHGRCNWTPTRGSVVR
jgi:hypothetical protein